jgi:hypothetical protein
MKMTYDELQKEIEAAPMSWLPALLIVAAQACYDKGALQPGGASKLVGRVEAERHKEPHE